MNFDPQKYLVRLKQGGEYLPVQARVAWLRNEHPDWGILTEFLSLNDDYAIAKATITDETGRLISQGCKREDGRHFGDFAEKAETGAIGRALAHAGFGTLFALNPNDRPEYEAGRIVDGPLDMEPVLAVIPVDPTEAKRIEYAALKSEFASLCGELLGEDVSTFDDSQTVEFVEGIMGSGYKITTARPTIGNYKAVIAKMKEQRG
jgi:hypothetical protein